MNAVRVCVFAAALAVASQGVAEPRSSRKAVENARARAPKPMVVLPEAAGQPGAIVYAPTAPGKQHVSVMLHGMCDEPENECPYFIDSVTPNGWLVCPRATLRCDGGGSIWSFRNFERDVERSVARARAAYPGEIGPEAPRTLIGFSLGAIRGLDLAHAGQGRWKSVVLIGAKLQPDARRLRAAGVERVLLAAGDRDMMKWHMSAQAHRLVRQGYPAAFMSLGKIGHWFPHDFAARLERGLAWAHGDDTALAPSAPGEVVWRPR